MRIAILKDEKSKDGSIDEMDNQDEADFAGKCLSGKHTVVQIPFVSDLGKVMSDIRGFNPDVVFNLVESVCGSGAMSIIAVQMLEVMGIPFTGNHIFSHMISADKSLAKRVLMENGIPVPDSSFRPGCEYMLKARNEHASIALDDNCISKFASEKALDEALAAKKSETGLEWIAERYIDGREFNCAFLGDVDLPPTEIRYDDRFVGHKIITYEAKWHEQSDAYRMSLRSFDVEENVRRALLGLMGLCRRKLDLKGYARVEFRMDGNGGFYVIDINTNPCISPDSGFTAMALRHGISNEEMFQMIVDDAFNS